MPPPRFTLRAGSLLVHVSTPEDFELALAKIKAQPCEANATGVLASCADKILDAAAEAHPNRKLRGLRDIAYHCPMNSADKKFVTQLNAACSLTRHLPAVDIQRAAARVAAALRGVSGDQPSATSVDDEDPVDQPRASEWAIARQWESSLLCDGHRVQPCGDGHAGSEPGHTNAGPSQPQPEQVEHGASMIDTVVELQAGVNRLTCIIDRPDRLPPLRRDAGP